MLPADEGPSSAEAADVFTTLLIDIKAAVCLGNSSCGFVISADSEPPQWNDYHRLNASKMDGKNIDFVNYMLATLDSRGEPSLSYSDRHSLQLLAPCSARQPSPWPPLTSLCQVTA